MENKKEDKNADKNVDLNEISKNYIPKLTEKIKNFIYNGGNIFFI